MALFKNIRVGGIVVAAVSAAIGYLYMHYLISQAKQGVEYLHVSERVMVICVLLTVLGLFCAALGDKAIGILKIDNRNLTVLNVLMLFVLAAVGFASYVYEMSILASYGYK
jgi:hypothetical protein